MTEVIEAEVLRGVVDVRPPRHPLGIALGDVALHLAVAVDRASERRALGGVCVHDLDRSPSDPEAHRGERHALDREVAHHATHRAARRSDHVACRHVHVVKHEFGRGGGAHPELVIELLTEREPVHPLLHHKQRDIASVPRRIFSVHQEHVAELARRHGAVCDPHFSPGDAPVVAVWNCDRRHAEHVGASVGFAHAHPSHQLTAADAREKPLTLFVVSVDAEVVGKQHRVREVRKAESRVGRGQLLMRDHCRDGVHPRTAVLLGHRDPEQPELGAQASKQRQIEHLLAIVLCRLRRHLALGKRAHHLSQQLMFVRRVEEIAHLRLGVAQKMIGGSGLDQPGLFRNDWTAG